MDPATGLTILGGAIGSAKLLEKFLGPTADYLGEGLKSWSEKRFNNLKNIFDNAIKKTGSNIEIEGQVPPKVLRGILSEGSFADDFISVEYYGGVLASSRSGISRDDRGTYFNSLITRLSTYQLRTHYVFYHLIYKIFKDSKFNIALGDDLVNMELFCSYIEFISGLDIDEQEMKNFSSILNHVVFGLAKENLINNFFSFGNVEHLKKKFKNAPDGGIIFQPSTLGAELFLWANGKGNLPVQRFLNSDHKFDFDSRIKLPLNAISTKNKNDQLPSTPPLN